MTNDREDLHGRAGARSKSVVRDAESDASPGQGVGGQPRPPRTSAILEHTASGGQARRLDRELSWLQFDERVLWLADRDDVPLLERARFLSIFAGNLDEFFQVRVAGLKEQVAAGVAGSGVSDLPPAVQLRRIHEMVRRMLARQDTLLRERLLPALAAHGIEIVEWAALRAGERRYCTEVFREQIYPVLTPLAVDPAHPFPYISNLSLNLAVTVRDPADGETRFARIKVPPLLPQLLEVGEDGRFVPLEQVIAAHLDHLFVGLEVLSHNPFRVTRNADLEIEESEADDLLLAIESELSSRRFGRAVRLEVEHQMPAEVLQLLQRELAVEADDIHRLDGPLGLRRLSLLADLDRPELCYPTVQPTTQSRLAGDAHAHPPDLFAVLRDGDVLVQHPYDSFATSTQAFIEQAARDPDVLAIKQTLYRTSGQDSGIVGALRDAAADGKQVVALVELKARFDEEANIEWARVLEEAGAHVAYGVMGYKTHTKIALVVRREGGAIRRYAHIGTGNYNDRTARAYEDLGLLTADQELGADLSDLFNVLTGYARHTAYRRLLVAPTTLRARVLELIARESQAPDGRITAKVNSLVDGEIIEALYEASRAGTEVTLLVRGICCLVPGVEGMSENIRVRSILGRHLEHSRIYRFGREPREVVHLIGSADWMPRNLDRRVEAVTPVAAPHLRARLDEILELGLADDELAWELGADGAWERVPTVEGLDSQAELQRRAWARAHPAEAAADRERP
jgi:polyphosphate kinase